MEILRHLDILKILMIFILLFVSIGSISAADNSDIDLDGTVNDDFNLDDNEFLDDESDEDFDLDDECLDDEDGDDDWDGIWYDVEYDDLDDDLDDDSDDCLDDDFDYVDNYTDYDYLKLKIKAYLHQYGNYTDFNWTESNHFLNEYQIYLSNSSNYTLNQDAEGYETYLKIFDSITSTFGEYNLTENQTAYLKFMIFYYLNYYGNVSANYTWDENQSFANFTFYGMDILGCVFPGASFSGNATLSVFYDYVLSSSNYVQMLGNATDSNSTMSHMANIDLPEGDSWWSNLIVLVLLLIMMVLIFV